MSEANEAVDKCCASCGKAEIDDIKLKDCDGCDLVKYCSDECMGDHKSEHKEACKKRAEELRDKLLFKQPESSHLGDCPICSLPLPLDRTKSVMYTCCCKIICGGCLRANAVRDNEERLQRKCSFCRKPISKTDEESDERRMKRVEANDPVAMNEEGSCCYNKGDYDGAFDYFSKAAKLGYAESHYHLACLYRDGEGVEKDKGEEIRHMEEAAIGGHPKARYNLGRQELTNGNVGRSTKHLVISAAQGFDDSIKSLMKAFKLGLVKKEVLAAALRAHKAAVDATKSPQRKVAEEAIMKYRSIKNQS